MNAKSKLFWAISFLLLLAQSSISQAGAWLEPKGQWLFIPAAKFYFSSHYWDQNKNLQPTTNYHLYEFNPYFEYGLTNNFTIGINPFVRHADKNQDKTGWHLTDIELLTRYLLWKNDWQVFSTQLSFNFTTRHDFSHDLTPPFLPPTLSDAQDFLKWRLLYGLGGELGQCNYYLNLEAGIQRNFNGASDQLQGDLTLGWKSPGEKLEILLKSTNSFSLHNKRAIIAPDYSLSTISPSVIWWMTKNVGLQLGVNQDIYGYNVGKGTAPFVALFIASGK
jgi:hypothetical protein